MRLKKRILILRSVCRTFRLVAFGDHHGWIRSVRQNATCLLCCELLQGRNHDGLIQFLASSFLIVVVVFRRTSSRVLARPGGNSSLTFGILPSPSPKKEETPEPEAVVAKAEPAVPKPEEQEPETSDLPPTEPETPVMPQEDTTTTTSPSHPTTAPALSTNAFVSGSNMNGGCTMAGGGRPSSRVLAPPGGHTSIQLG